jgi:hypothetical protein
MKLLFGLQSYGLNCKKHRIQTSMLNPIVIVAVVATVAVVGAERL